MKTSTALIGVFLSTLVLLAVITSSSQVMVVCMALFGLLSAICGMKGRADDLLAATSLVLVCGMIQSSLQIMSLRELFYASMLVCAGLFLAAMIQDRYMQKAPRPSGAVPRNTNRAK